jgi:two-component system KDP operon response regulator KdpE
MTGPLVLVVEDDPQVRRFLRASLDVHGYRVVEASTLAEAMLAATSHNPEVVLLDLGLPDGDGLEFTRRIREWSTVPLLVISARGRESDKVEALDAGADDYLTKPFGVNELLARIRVAMRRAVRVDREDEGAIDCGGGLRLDLAARTVWKGDVELHLTPTEYRLFSLLARHLGKVLTHRQILKEVWGPNHSEHVHYVRVYMAELRRKIEDDPTRPVWIVTETAVGYRLRERA